MAEHPITPPPELRRLWAQQAQRMYPRDSIAWQEHIVNQAARWSADPDLWAYVKWTEDCGHHPSVSTAHWSNLMADFYIDSDNGRIGQFWWCNSNNVDRLWMGNVSPWVKRWCIRWGTCGFGRNVHVFMEPIND